VETVVCEEKHMGSRTVVVVCRDEAAVQARFGIDGEGLGVIYTRTGRRFFTDLSLEQWILRRLIAVLDHGGCWERFQTEWF
jgi:protein phosphatase